ncbi:MAG: NAD(P)-binding domain-containing protein [Pseudomonadota bacterium]
MKIGIIGTGTVATRLQLLFSNAGHDVVLGSRTPEVAQVSYEKACTDKDVIVLAIPFTAVEALLAELADVIGSTVVVDATNPLNDDWSPYLMGDENSAGETIQALLPDAKIVKALNTIFADIMTADGLSRNGQSATAFIAGDDDHAIGRVSELARSIGLHPIQTGPLKNSRYLEAMAHLNIAIAVGQGGGTDAAFIYHSV